MINFFKTTKWWMYLPFSCLYGHFYMMNWILGGVTRKDISLRIIFLLCNVIYTIITLQLIIDTLL